MCVDHRNAVSKFQTSTDLAGRQQNHEDMMQQKNELSESLKEEYLGEQRQSDQSYRSM